MDMYTLQLATYLNNDDANKYIKHLPKELQSSAYVVKAGKYYAVRLFYVDKDKVQQLKQLAKQYKFKDYIILKTKYDPCKYSITKGFILKYCSAYSPKIITSEKSLDNRRVEANIHIAKDVKQTYEVKHIKIHKVYEYPVEIKHADNVKVLKGYKIGDVIYPEDGIVDVIIEGHDDVEINRVDLQHNVTHDIPGITNIDKINAYIRLPLHGIDTSFLVIKLNNKQVKPEFIASNHKFTYIKLRSLKLKVGVNVIAVYHGKHKIFAKTVIYKPKEVHFEKTKVRVEAINGHTALLEVYIPGYNGQINVKVDGVKRLYSYKSRDWSTSSIDIDVKNGYGYIKVQEFTNDKLEITINNKYTYYVVLPNMTNNVVFGVIDINNKDNSGSAYIDKQINDRLQIKAELRDNKLTDKYVDVGTLDKDILPGQQNEEEFISRTQKHVINVRYKLDNDLYVSINRDAKYITYGQDVITTTKRIVGDNIKVTHTNFDLLIANDKQDVVITDKYVIIVRSYLKEFTFNKGSIQTIYIHKISNEGDIIQIEKLQEDIDYQIFANKVVLFTPLIATDDYHYRVYVIYETKKTKKTVTQVNITPNGYNTRISLTQHDEDKYHIDIKHKDIVISTSNEDEYAIVYKDNVKATRYNGITDITVGYKQLKSFYYDDNQDKVIGIRYNTTSLRSVNNKLQVQQDINITKHIKVSITKTLAKDDDFTNTKIYKDNISVQYSNDKFTTSATIGKDFKMFNVSTNVKGIKLSSRYETENLSAKRNVFLNRLSAPAIQVKGFNITPSIAIVNDNSKTKTFGEFAISKQTDKYAISFKPSYNSTDHKLNTYAMLRYDNGNHIAVGIVDSKREMVKLSYTYRSPTFDVFSYYKTEKSNSEGMIRLATSNNWLSFNKANNVYFAMIGKRFKHKDYSFNVGIGTFLFGDNSKSLVDVEVGKQLTNHVEFYVGYNNLPIKKSNINFGLRLAY